MLTTKTKTGQDPALTEPDNNKQQQQQLHNFVELKRPTLRLRARFTKL